MYASQKNLAEKSIDDLIPDIPNRSLPMNNQKPHWQLMRQDDNGNRFLMTTFVAEEEAINTMEYYQSKGHKQTYWVEGPYTDTETESEIEQKR